MFNYQHAYIIYDCFFTMRILLYDEEIPKHKWNKKHCTPSNEDNRPHWVDNDNKNEMLNEKKSVLDVTKKKNHKSVRFFENVEFMGVICIPKQKTVNSNLKKNPLSSKLIKIVTKIHSK